MTQMPSFDYRGLKCPLPVLKARRALAQLSTGEVIEFLADDPASPLDMSHFCEAEGHQLAPVSYTHLTLPTTMWV